MNKGFTSPTGFKNLLINGGFDIWQRGTSFTGIAAYTADRWFCVLGADLTEQDIDGSLKLTASGTSSRIVQRIEGDNLYGRTVTVSLEAKTTNTNILIYIVNSNGTETVSENIIFNSEYSSNSATFIVPTDGDGAYTEIRAYAGDNLDVMNIKNIQVELGEYATEFELRPIGLELSLCQRYYNIMTLVFNSSYSGDASSGRLSNVKLQSTMRDIPIIVPSNIQYNNSSNLVINGVTKDGFNTQVDSLAAGKVTVDFDYTAEAEL